MTRPTLHQVCLVLVFFAAVPTAVGQAYTVQQIPKPSGALAVFPLRINNAGQVVGQAQYDTTFEACFGYYRSTAISFYNGVTTLLGTLPGAHENFAGATCPPFSTARDINSAGLIVGGSSDSTGGFSGFLYDGTFHTTASLNSSSANVFPVAINNSGQIAGNQIGGANGALMSASGGALTSIGSGEEIFSLNDSGQVLTTSYANGTRGIPEISSYTSHPRDSTLGRLPGQDTRR